MSITILPDYTVLKSYFVKWLVCTIESLTRFVPEIITATLFDIGLVSIFVKEAEFVKGQRDISSPRDTKYWGPVIQV